MLNEMFNFEDLADVTLVSEDGQEMKGHTVVLSACSSVLKDAIRFNPKKDAKIHLKGIHYMELKTILEFIYLGNTTVDPERINNFISASKILRIYEFSTSVKNLVKQDNNSKILVGEQNLQENDHKSLLEDQHIQHNDTKTIAKKQYLKHNHIKNFIEDKLIQDSDSKNCTRESNGSDNIMKMWNCSLCDYCSRRKIDLRKHIEVKHEGVKYDCKECNNQYATKEKLKRHIKAIHEGLKFICYECNSQFTRKESLTYHFNSQHEGIKLECNKCNYQCVSKKSLKQHVKTVHDGVKVQCKMCTNQYSGMRTLKIHVKLKHDIQDPLSNFDF